MMVLSGAKRQLSASLHLMGLKDREDMPQKIPGRGAEPHVCFAVEGNFDKSSFFAKRHQKTLKSEVAFS